MYLTNPRPGICFAVKTLNQYFVETIHVYFVIILSTEIPRSLRESYKLNLLAKPTKKHERGTILHTQCAHKMDII